MNKSTILLYVLISLALLASITTFVVVLTRPFDSKIYVVIDDPSNTVEVDGQQVATELVVVNTDLSEYGVKSGEELTMNLDDGSTVTTKVYKFDGEEGAPITNYFWVAKNDNGNKLMSSMTNKGKTGRLSVNVPTKSVFKFRDSKAQAKLENDVKNLKMRLSRENYKKSTPKRLSSFRKENFKPTKKININKKKCNKCKTM